MKGKTTDKINPYTLTFGKEPVQLVSRIMSTENVVDDFSGNPPSNQICLLTGVRGSGKTVMMTSISKIFKSQKDWFVINLSPELDLLDCLAAELGEIRELNHIFRLEGLGISVAGLSIDIKNNTPVTDVKVAITKMLEICKKHKKKVLVTIDEATNNKSVKKFASVFQILLREDLPICLLMTGLYENIRMLQNEKSLTFLYRAPRIEMTPLNIKSVARNYHDVLNISQTKALEMANLTKGYPYAFQLLGYLTWEANGDYKKIISEFKDYLYDYVYEKIFSEMSEKDRFIAAGIAKSKSGNISEIKALLKIQQNEWNPYRRRLLEKGIISIPERGKVEFILPFFSDFILYADEM